MAITPPKSNTAQDRGTISRTPSAKESFSYTFSGFTDLLKYTLTYQKNGADVKKFCENAETSQKHLMVCWAMIQEGSLKCECFEL